MKSIKNITLLMIVGLLLQGRLNFAYDQDQEGQNILNRLRRRSSDTNADSSWKPTGPTVEDIQAATKVENLAAKGSKEDKLIHAVKKRNLKQVKTFIDAGANLEARDAENMTALMRAAEQGDSQIVITLLDAGADIKTQDRFNFTAFEKAAYNNHVDVVKILIAKGAAADSSFEDVFISSVHKGNTEMVKALMVERARIKHDTLHSAYMMALNRRSSNPELFKLIAEALNERRTN